MMVDMKHNFFSESAGLLCWGDHQAISRSFYHHSEYCCNHQYAKTIWWRQKIGCVRFVQRREKNHIGQVPKKCSWRQLSLSRHMTLNSYGTKISTSMHCWKASNSSNSGSLYQAHTSSDDPESDDEGLEYGDNEGDAWLVDECTTPFSQISVIELDEGADHEFAGAYLLKLDDSNIIHSVSWNNDRVWTGSYYDVFASLPPVLPDGPVAILGLGAGTLARILLHVWPSLHLEGWELDPEVVRVAREYFGLKDLESSVALPSKHKIGKNRFRSFSNITYQIRGPEVQDIESHAPFQQPGSSRRISKKWPKRRGRLVVHVGDALGPDAVTEGGFAGIIVDLFSDGHVCKELGEVGTWTLLKERLCPGGRVMVNCVPNRTSLGADGDYEKVRHWDQLMQATARAMETTFPGEVSIRVLKEEGNNVMMMSGKLPDVDSWSLKVPDCLVKGIFEWRSWDGCTPPVS